MKLGVASEEDVDRWLRGIGLKSLEKTDTGNWYFLQKYKDSEIQINITYDENESPIPPMVGVGCFFLEQPKKNQCELYKKLLEFQAGSVDTKFVMISSGAIILVTQRSAVDLDPSELQDMIDMILIMYNQYHEDCLSIIS
ncbi:MAG: hypothetical protein JSV09_08505 [Thermoplasmata archaeon]|nr:MAG: hypothetical protein JSV09_08505 [Thermoplasmata archaeon]